VTATLAEVTEKRAFRVLVTRPRNQASALAELLAAAGTVPIVIPTIEIAPPASYRALDDALLSLQEYNWVLFTSANAVQVFAERAEAKELRPKAQRIAVIGPATARAVEEKLKLPVDRMPERFVAESLVEALRGDAPHASMLLVRAAIARDVVPARLEAAGAQVTVVDAYRNVIPEDSVAKVRELFLSDPPDAITFTSASTAQNLHALLEAARLGIPKRTVLASIGPITSQAMREAGMEPTMEARKATMASLVEALLASAGR
jgi:uroporphyrinogen-III synthase